MADPSGSSIYAAPGQDCKLPLLILSPVDTEQKNNPRQDMSAFAWLWCCFGSRQKTRKPRGPPTAFDVDLEAGLVDAPQGEALVSRPSCASLYLAD